MKKNAESKAWRHRGGGGAHRAFLHQAGRFDGKATNDAYASLSTEEKSRYKELGRLSTWQHNYGERAFGPTHKQASARSVAASASAVSCSSPQTQAQEPRILSKSKKTQPQQQPTSGSLFSALLPARGASRKVSTEVSPPTRASRSLSMCLAPSFLKHSTRDITSLVLLGRLVSELAEKKRNCEAEELATLEEAKSFSNSFVESHLARKKLFGEMCRQQRQLARPCPCSWRQRHIGISTAKPNEGIPSIKHAPCRMGLCVCRQGWLRSMIGRVANYLKMHGTSDLTDGKLIMLFRGYLLDSAPKTQKGEKRRQANPDDVSRTERCGFGVFFLGHIVHVSMCNLRPFRPVFTELVCQSSDMSFDNPMVLEQKTLSGAPCLVQPLPVGLRAHAARFSLGCGFRDSQPASRSYCKVDKTACCHCQCQP